MSVQIIKSAWDLFQNTDTQDFTGKIMKGIAIFQLLKPEDYEQKDFDRMKWLRDYTHENIMISIYELDRMVDQTTGRRINLSFTLNDNTFTQDKIQYYCCCAIEEVHEIIYRTLKKFKIEIALDVDGYSKQSIDNW
jgi:hypothetical protein